MTTSSAESMPGPAPPPLRMLVILPGRVSNALAMRGLVASLAATGRQLIALTRDEQAAIFDPTLLALRLRYTPSDLDAPLSLPSEALDVDRLRALDCDEALLLEPSLWSARSTAAGIAKRSGPRGSGPGSLFGLFLTHQLSKATDPLEETARRWARELAIPWQAMPALHIPELWRRIGKDRLRSAKLDLQSPTVGLYLGNAGGRGSVWPAAKMEELARQLRRRRPNLQIVILASEAELWQSVLLYERTGKIHPVIGPDLEADGLAAVIRHLHLVIAADSTLLHLAAALATPTLGLYERHALSRAPRGEAVHHLQRQPLKKLEVDDVVERCQQILDARELPAEAPESDWP